MRKTKKTVGNRQQLAGVRHLCGVRLNRFFNPLRAHWIDGLPGIGESSPLAIKTVVLVTIVLPVFNPLLFVWHSLLGQRKFGIDFLRIKLLLISKIGLNERG
ncbi:MAG TPA: hypothetical protein EYP36_02050 [Calditrichaeota bacterium]|nr:hypothetical protein [Calditrichota bacterium]